MPNLETAVELFREQGVPRPIFRGPRPMEGCPIGEPVTRASAESVPMGVPVGTPGRDDEAWWREADRQARELEDHLGRIEHAKRRIASAQKEIESQQRDWSVPAGMVPTAQTAEQWESIASGLEAKAAVAEAKRGVGGVHVTRGDALGSAGARCDEACCEPKPTAKPTEPCQPCDESDAFEAIYIGYDDAGNHRYLNASSGEVRAVPARLVRADGAGIGYFSDELSSTLIARPVDVHAAVRGSAGPM